MIKFRIKQMENHIPLSQLSLDEINRKFKALKNDPTIVSMTLLVTRKSGNPYKSSEKVALKGLSRYEKPSNVDMLFKSRKNQKQTMENGEVKTELSMNQIEENKVRKQYTKQDGKQPNQIGTANPENSILMVDRKFKKGIKYYDSANYEEAINMFEEIYEYYREKLEANLNDLNQLNEINRTVSNVTFHLGNSYFKKKHIEKAIEIYKINHQEENPKQKGRRKGNLATCYAYQNYKQQALTHYKEALKILAQYQQIDLSNIYYNVGVIYLQQKMYNLACQCFKLSISQRKQKSRENQDMLYKTYLKLGVSLRGSQLIEESINTLSIALSFADRGVNSSNNSTFEVLKEIAICNEQLQNWNEALQCYEKMYYTINNQQISGKGYIYHRIGLIFKIKQNLTKMKSYMKLSADEYEKQGKVDMAGDLRRQYLVEN